ncbi:phosphotriesterase family protein [Dactylosporangium sp. McL0621]|uniref:phosphotriesterase family protein n=1 Tax=Dactylosporangium sp. McL0621 TaxID=3415678 RepID=UPI003CECAD5F
MTATIRTVTGDVPGLGITDAHDHLFFRSRALPGQELDDIAAARGELTAFATAGGSAMVQWTPLGLGRGAESLPDLSRETGVRIVAATGLHRAEHYAPELLTRVMPRLAELFTTELTTGIGTTGVRAGLIKVAGGFHGLDTHARSTLHAAAAASTATGAPIAVHLEAGTASAEVLDFLDVAPSKVILGHLERFPDVSTAVEAAARGAFVALDGPSRANAATDWRLRDLTTAIIEAGHADQLLFGGDTTTARARGSAEGPGPVWLLERLRPWLEHRFGTDIAEAVFVTNPSRAFAAEWP